MAHYFPSDTKFFFNIFRTYLQSSVSLSYFSWSNDLLWLLYLSLNFTLVNPIYATCSFSKDTVALYVMQLERQFPSSGHLVGCLQLHVFLFRINDVFFVYYFCIMCLDDLLHISRAPIADLCVVFVE